MTAEDTATASEPASVPAAPRAYQLLPAWRWRLAAFLLAGAAQLISISALTGANRPPASWAMLLLAIAPALVCALAAFGPADLARYAAPLSVLVLLAGVIGAVTHTGLFFVPALAAAVAGILPLWRRPSAD